MKTYRYSTEEIRKEYLRSAVGITVVVLPLLLFQPSSVIVYILILILCLFLLYGLRTFDRGKSAVMVDKQGIRKSAITTKAILWEDLETIQLLYFSTRRDGEKGWLQLKLKGRGVRLNIESTLNGFEELARACLTVARARGIPMDRTTLRNSHAFGLLPDEMDTDF